MKRSEMELNIATNIVITKPYIDFKEAQALAEIALISVLENGMLPPPDKTDVIHSSLVYCYYIDKTYTDCERIVEVEDSYGELDCSRSKLWEPEDD